jgi:hypothetical protein
MRVPVDEAGDDGLAGGFDYLSRRVVEIISATCRRRHTPALYRHATVIDYAARTVHGNDRATSDNQVHGCTLRWAIVLKGATEIANARIMSLILI